MPFAKGGEDQLAAGGEDVGDHVILVASAGGPVWIDGHRRAGRALGEWRLSDCSLAVTLEPCPMCAGAMVNARLGRVIYGARDPKAGACHTLFKIPVDRRLNHEVTVIGGVMEQECGELLKSFFRERRRANRAKRA